jgi:hypothetical protein
MEPRQVYHPNIQNYKIAVVYCEFFFCLQKLI